MNIKNLHKVQNLNSNLVAKQKQLNRVDRALKNKDKFETVRISIGGDQYSNGKVFDTTINLTESIDGKRLLGKLRNKVWAEIVAIRTELRELGVDP